MAFKRDGKIREAGSRMSSDSVRSLYDYNFSLIRRLLEGIIATSNGGNNNGNIPNLGVLQFPVPPTDGVHSIVYDNGWFVRKLAGTQYQFDNNEKLVVSSRHQYIVVDQLILNDDSSVEIETGGQLVILD